MYCLVMRWVILFVEVDVILLLLVIIMVMLVSVVIYVNVEMNGRMFILVFWIVWVILIEILSWEKFYC